MKEQPLARGTAHDASDPMSTARSDVQHVHGREPAVEADRELAEAVRVALQRADEPQRINQLRKLLTGPFRRSEDELARVVRQEVQAGRLFEFPRYGSSPKPRYWAYDAREYARRLILRATRGTPQTYGHLRKKLSAPLKGFPDSEKKSLLEQMVARRELWQHPPRRRGAAVRYGVDPPRPADYLKDVIARLEKCVRVLEEAGVLAERTLADLGDLIGRRFGQAARKALLADLSSQPDAATDALATPAGPPHLQTPRAGQAQTQSQPFETATAQTLPAQSSVAPGAGEGPVEAEWNIDTVAEQILAAMPRVEPRAPEGALVSIRSLRNCPELLSVPKDVFDQAALELARRHVVALHRHDYPSSLSADERQKLVQDERGNLYMGIALRIEQ